VHKNANKFTGNEINARSLAKPRWDTVDTSSIHPDRVAGVLDWSTNPGLLAIS